METALVPKPPSMESAARAVAVLMLKVSLPPPPTSVDPGASPVPRSEMKSLPMPPRILLEPVPPSKLLSPAPPFIVIPEVFVEASKVSLPVPPMTV